MIFIIKRHCFHLCHYEALDRQLRIGAELNVIARHEAICPSMGQIASFRCTPLAITVEKGILRNDGGKGNPSQ